MGRVTGKYAVSTRKWHTEFVFAVMSSSKLESDFPSRELMVHYCLSDKCQR